MNTELSWVPVGEFDRALAGIADPYDRCRAFSALSRINALYMITRAGSGHLGSSFSAADLVSFLFLYGMRDPFARTGDVYFSSKGHDAPGLYAALIGLGLLEESLVHKLRRIDGLPGHPDVHTPHMLFNTGSLGMGISKAKGVILANRLLGRSQRVFVLTGDGELQEGQNWESLTQGAHRAMGELTVVVDHNKIQSDTYVRDVNDLGDLAGRFESCGWGVLRCDGHDFVALESAFRERAERFADRPAVVIADTVKGYGAATFAAPPRQPQPWLYDHHSGAPSTVDYESGLRELLATATEILGGYGLAPLRLSTVDHERPAPVSGELLPEEYGHALVELADRDERVVAFDADLVLDTGLIPFSRRHPERFVECGIAEQDMVSMAGGVAARGLLPFVHSFSCFLHARPNEQIYTNATEGRKVVYVGSLAGLLPAAPGHSHQAVRDISAVAAMPDLVAVEPANGAQVRALLPYLAELPESVYLRLSSVRCPAEVSALAAAVPMVGTGTVVRAGGRVVAIGHGPVVLGQLLGAADLLAAEGTELTVVNLPWLNRVDQDWLAALAAGADHLLVVEDHYVRGGQADLVARALAELRIPVAFRGIGLTRVPRCGTPAQALDAHELSAERLAETVRGTVLDKPYVPNLDVSVG